MVISLLLTDKYDFSLVLLLSSSYVLLEFIAKAEFKWILSYRLDDLFSSFLIISGFLQEINVENQCTQIKLDIYNRFHS